MPGTQLTQIIAKPDQVPPFNEYVQVLYDRDVSADSEWPGGEGGCKY